ncbi:MAG: acetoacetate decarboxylase family protein [Pseudomonadota bacterium]
MKKPFYVDRGGEQVYRAPFTAENVDFWGFLLKANKRRMRETICDLCLNDPSDTPDRFKMAMPYAMVVFNNMTALTSIDPPFDVRGVFPEKEFAIWTLVEDTVANRLYWFQPYIFVDNAYALTMGREIYGFPKALGWFELPEDAGHPDRLAMDTIVVPTFGPGQPAARERLIEVKRTGDGDGGVRPVADAVALARTIRDVLTEAGEDAALIRHELHDLWNLNVMMVFLKQFRAAGDTTRCDYQAITNIDCKATKFHGGHILLSPYSVDFGDFDSHPVRSDLGLKDGALKPIVSFWARFDFWIGPGATLWTHDEGWISDGVGEGEMA